MFSCAVVRGSRAFGIASRASVHDGQVELGSGWWGVMCEPVRGITPIRTATPTKRERSWRDLMHSSTEADARARRATAGAMSGAGRKPSDRSAPCAITYERDRAGRKMRVSVSSTAFRQPTPAGPLEVNSSTRLPSCACLSLRGEWADGKGGGGRWKCGQTGVCYAPPSTRLVGVLEVWRHRE